MKTADLETAIMSRMVSEEAKDMSDDEIYRTLHECVAGHRLVPIAKQMAAEGVTLAAYLKTGNVVRS